MQSIWAKGANIFHESESHFKILGARMVTLKKFLTENSEILGDTIQTPWRPGTRELCTTEWRFRGVINGIYVKLSKESLHLKFCNISKTVVYKHVNLQIILQVERNTYTYHAKLKQRDRKVHTQMA